MLLDGTIVCAHPCYAGALKKDGQLAVDALGNPLRYILTASQCYDSPQAKVLIAGYSTQAVIADKGNDSAPLINLIKANGTEVVIRRARIAKSNVNMTSTCTKSDP